MLNLLQFRHNLRNPEKNTYSRQYQQYPPDELNIVFFFHEFCC